MDSPQHHDQHEDRRTDSGDSGDLGWISTTTTTNPRSTSSTSTWDRSTTANIRHDDDDGSPRPPTQRVDDGQSVSRGVNSLDGGDTGPGSGNLDYNCNGETTEDGAGGGGGGFISTASNPQPEPTSTARMLVVDSESGDPSNEMVSSKFDDQQVEVGLGGHHEQPNIEPSLMLDAITGTGTDDNNEDRGWWGGGISISTDDGIKLDFTTELRGFTIWLAMVFWPGILLSLLCNIILILVVCSCCTNRRKYRNLKRQLYIRVPLGIPSSYTLPTTTDSQG